MKIDKRSPSLVLAFGFLVLSAGCSGGSSGSVTVEADVSPESNVIVLLTSDSESATLARTVSLSGSKDVEISQIERLTFTVTEVSLDYAGEGEGDDQNGTEIVVFSGEMDVDVVDLVGISEVISSAQVPAGAYTKIRLSIADPMLVLKSDPDTVITDIHLTANGRLFVSETFEMPEGEFYLVILVFEDIHLVETGNGSYVLTPQLRAEIDVESADALVSGTIVAIDSEAGTLILAQNDTEIEVYYAEAAIFLPSDTDTPTGTESDLTEGAEVLVTGTLWLDGLLTADSIEIVAMEAAVSGTIIDIDKEAGTFMLVQGETALEVLYLGAPIFLPGDIDAATGTEADLMEDTEVVVKGTVWVNGLMTTDSIEVAAMEQ